MSKMEDHCKNCAVPKLISQILYGAGILVLILSTLALIGWQTHTYILVQVSPNHPPIQYNTAIALFLLSLGLLTVLKSPRLTMVLSILVFLIGALTLAEYIFYTNLNIDQLFMKTTLAVKTPFPGRMVPNTAFGFLFASIALFFNTEVMVFPGKRFVAFILSCLIFTLGIIAIIGYSANLASPYGWGMLMGMNIITAFCFTFVGVGLVLSSLRYFNRDELVKKNSIPVIIVLVGCVFFLLLWHALLADANNKIILESKYDATEIKNEIYQKLSVYSLTLSRMGKRMEFQHPISRAEWFFDAKLYLNDMKSYQAIAWKSNIRKEEWGLENNGSALTINTQQMIQSCIEQARADHFNGDIFVTMPTTQNLENFCIVRYSSEGYLIGLINMQFFLNDILNNLNYTYYQILLNINKTSLAVHTVNSSALSSEWMVTTFLKAIDKNLQISVRPTEALLKKNNSIYPLVALITGPLLTILLALALRFWMIAKQEKIDLAEAIRTREELDVRFHAITAYAKDAILMLNKEGRIVFWNQAATEIFGYSVTEVIGKFVHEVIIPPQYAETYIKEFEQFQINNKDVAAGKNLELIALKKNGTEFPIDVSISTVKIGRDWEIVAMMRDITERKKAEQIIQHQANYDALTDLPNRILFKERLKLSLSQADRLNTWASVLSIDLDGFKLVNDQYGHDVGDELLKQASQRLLHCIRQTDTATRLGGDEFAISLTNLHNKAELSLVSQKILDELSEVYIINNIDITITGSIGIAIYPSHTLDQNDLMIKADQAMYMAKKSGKNKFCFFLQ